MLSILSLDKRSLACLRIFLGIVLIFDFFNYASLASFYLSDEGFATRANFLLQQANIWNWSLLYISGSSYFIKFFLAWHFITLLFFIFGYKTKWQTFFLWVQIVSMHNRNWVVTNGGDDLLRCCLLILIFLPLGEIWSIDARKKIPLNITTNNFINLALFSQLSIMYVASAIFKNHPIWNEEYSALFYALNLDMFVRPFGTFIKNHDVLIKPLTACAYYFELFGPSLIFLGCIKKIQTFSRYLIVISFTFFHLFIDLMLDIGTFPFFAIALWSAFLPSHFWDSLNPSINKIKTFLQTYETKFQLWWRLSNNIPKPKLFLTNILGIFLTVNLLFWPMSDPKFNLPLQEGASVDFLRTTNRWLATFQNWYLFAPYPKIDNVWVEINGHLNDGSVIDLFRLTKKEHPLTETDVQTFYHQEKWRKILLKIEENDLYRNWITSYYCNHWQDIRPQIFDNEKLQKIEIISHNQLSTLRGIASRQRVENILTTYQCP